MFKNIDYGTSEGIATITLDRANKYNAFTNEMILELNEALREAQDDDGVYVIVLMGAGDGFCAGADVGKMDERANLTHEEAAAKLWAVQNVVRQLRGMAKPTIAAVNGPAIGAGCSFALACHLRTMASDAILREGFVRVGLIPGDGDGWLLPRLVGESKAREYLLTGKDITAEEADEMGLLVAIDDDAVGAAYDIAEDILELPVAAVRNTNRLIDPQRSFEEYCEAAIRYQRECRSHPEQSEAVEAFLENRPPEFDRDYS